jgi:hypothetical protein
VSTKQIVEINVEVRQITEKAYLVVITGPNAKPVKTWLPKSQVKETDCFAEGDEGTMTITYWIAKQKGLIEEEHE